MVGEATQQSLQYKHSESNVIVKNEKSEWPRGTSHSENSIVIKTEKIYKENEMTCRVCLKEGNIPIYGDDTYEDVSESLNVFAGVEVQVDDIYPKYLCKTCYSSLRSAILFRKTAQNSDQLLRKHTTDVMAYNNTDFDQTTENYLEVEIQEVELKNTIHDSKRCNKKFDSFKEYTEHKFSKEHENTRHTCPICNNTYTTRYFKKHLALHKPEFPYICETCGKKFKVQGHLAKHRLAHSYCLPFKCTLCPYKGRYNESLKLHMRSHTGEKPYQCSQCPTRFVSKSNLNKHMLKHKGVHDFKCESCQKGFYTKSDLELHFKCAHTDIKDYVCDDCGKAFGSRKQMLKHQLLMHKREKLKGGKTRLYLQTES